MSTSATRQTLSDLKTLLTDATHGVGLGGVKISPHPFPAPFMPPYAVIARIGSNEAHGLVQVSIAIGLVCDATADDETACLAAYDLEDDIIALVRSYDRSLGKDYGVVVKDIFRSDHYLASFKTDDDVTQGPFALIELQMEVEYQR